MARPSQEYHQLCYGTVTIDLARSLLNRGYYPVPVGGNIDGKSWLVPRSGHELWHPMEGGGDPPAETVMAAFHEFPGCGISVATPYMRNPLNNDFLFIDVDIDDPALIQAIADIINIPCPVRVGSRGVAFAVRYPAMRSIPAILNERHLSVPTWVKATKLLVPEFKHLADNGIDFLGLKIGHMLLPPTISKKASARDGHNVEYKWIPFPGTDTTIRLEDTDPKDLPELEPYHLMLIYQYCKNPKSSLFENYIGKTNPGDHHAPMLAATTYLWHEMFTQDEIEAICRTEAFRSSTDDANAEARYEEIRIAVKKLPIRAPDRKPAAQKGAVQSKKMPKDRAIADFIIQKYGGLDNLGIFSGVAYQWTEGRWRQIVELDNPKTPWARMYREIMTEFDDVGHNVVSSAISIVTSMMHIREPAPDSNYIPFRNGLLDVHTMQLRAVTREDFVLHTLEADWNPKATAPLWEKFLFHLMEPPDEFWENEPEKKEADRQRAIQAVEEFFGYCLVRSHDLQKMMYVIGKPDTGKSVLFKVLGGLLPKNWISSIAMDAFNDPNSLIQMATAHVNLAAEVGRRQREVDDVLLKVTVGEPVAVKLLYANKMQVVLPTRLIFQGNLPPDTTDSTGAIQRRIIMIRTTDHKPVNKVLDYERLLLKEADGILARLALAYKRLVERGRIDEPEYGAGIIETTRVESNSALLWMLHNTDPVEDTGEATQNQELFDHYLDWCTRTNMYRLSIVKWGTALSTAGVHSIRRRLPSGYIYARKLKIRSNIPAGVRY